MSDEKKYRVVMQLASMNIKGGIFLPGRIITRADLPAKTDAKFDHLVKDGWLVEVKEDGKIQTE